MAIGCLERAENDHHEEGAGYDDREERKEVENHGLPLSSQLVTAIIVRCPSGKVTPASATLPMRRLNLAMPSMLQSTTTRCVLLSARSSLRSRTAWCTPGPRPLR